MCIRASLHAGHDLADLLNDAHVGAADAGSDHADQNIVFLVDLRLLEINVKKSPYINFQE